MDTFKLHSSFKPTGDQPEAIRALTEGILAGERAQTLSSALPARARPLLWLTL